MTKVIKRFIKKFIKKIMTKFLKKFMTTISERNNRMKFMKSIDKKKF